MQASCDRIRVLLSALLDGETTASETATARAHLASCDACSTWYAAAGRINRLVRTTVAAPAEDVPDDLLKAAVAAAPGPGRSRTARLMRVALGAVGAGQFAIGLGQIAALRFSAGSGTAGGMTSDHLLHESAAWNIAIGAGFCWVALRRCRPATLLPLMTAFVGVLLLLSISDLASGYVAADMLLTHVLVVIGYAILLLLRHPGFDMLTPPTGRRWRFVARLDEGPDGAGSDSPDWDSPGWYSPGWYSNGSDRAGLDAVGVLGARKAPAASAVDVRPHGAVARTDRRAA